MENRDIDQYKYLFQKLGIKIPIFYGSLPENWNAKKLFNRIRNINVNWYNWYELDVVKLSKILKLFPKELESKEHVDLLLTLNRLNKEA